MLALQSQGHRTSIRFEGCLVTRALLLGVDVNCVRLVDVAEEGMSLDACRILLALLEELPVDAAMEGILLH